MTNASLRGDCARCAALCCIALAFDRSQLFAFDKEAGEPCRNLSVEGHDCTIHGELAARGFGGCVNYDCYGAGQLVTRDVFGGRSWRDDPMLLGPMMDAFRVLRQAQELRALLFAASELALDGEHSARLVAYQRALSGSDRWTIASVAELDRSGMLAAVRGFLRELRGAVPPGASAAPAVPAASTGRRPVL